MKTCSKCGEQKPFDDFYINRSAKSERCTYCKACSLTARQQWAAANPGRLAANARRWRERHPDVHKDSHRASVRVARAIKRGTLTRPSTCEQCAGPGPIEAAHHDYTKPLDVRWLCRSCHRRWDAQEPKLVGVAA